MREAEPVGVRVDDCERLPEVLGVLVDVGVLVGEDVSVCDAVPVMLVLCDCVVLGVSVPVRVSVWDGVHEGLGVTLMLGDCV